MDRWSFLRKNTYRPYSAFCTAVKCFVWEPKLPRGAHQIILSIQKFVCTLKSVNVCSLQNSDLGLRRLRLEEHVY